MCCRVGWNALRIRLNVFLHINKLALAVVEYILEESQFLRRDDTNAQTILHLPLTLERPKALIDVGGNVRMYVQTEFANADFVDQAVNLAL